VSYAKPDRCPECNGRFKEIKTDYGGGKIRRDCVNCTVRQWCDAQGNALGTPANIFLRRSRMRAHDAFDRLWKAGVMKRDEAYAWLKRELKSEKAVHMAELTTEQCLQVEKVSLDFVLNRKKPTDSGSAGAATAAGGTPSSGSD
jgi:hypothetical protein